MSFWEVFFSIIWFFLWVAWLVLLFRVFADVFQSDSSGWAKAGWAFFLLFFPFIGVLVYLIVHGDGMSQRSYEAASRAEANRQAYMQGVTAQSSSVGTELERLDGLRQRGVLTDEEFDIQKARLMS